MKEIRVKTYEITFDGIPVGTVDISDSDKYRWKTYPNIREKAPVFTDKHLIFGCIEDKWTDSIPFLKTRIESAIKNGNDKEWSDHGTGVGFCRIY